MASQSVLTTTKAAAPNAVAAPFVDLDNVGLRYSEIADAQALSDLRELNTSLPLAALPETAFPTINVHAQLQSASPDTIST